MCCASTLLFCFLVVRVWMSFSFFSGSKPYIMASFTYFWLLLPAIIYLCRKSKTCLLQVSINPKGSYCMALFTGWCITNHFISKSESDSNQDMLLKKRYDVFLCPMFNHLTGIISVRSILPLFSPWMVKRTFIWRLQFNHPSMLSLVDPCLCQPCTK